MALDYNEHKEGIFTVYTINFIINVQLLEHVNHCHGWENVIDCCCYNQWGWENKTFWV